MKMTLGEVFLQVQAEVGTFQILPVFDACTSFTKCGIDEAAIVHPWEEFFLVEARSAVD